jgi:hypothetical protein
VVSELLGCAYNLLVRSVLGVVRCWHVGSRCSFQLLLSSLFHEVDALGAHD